jgi:hypothetical protein
MNHICQFLEFKLGFFFLLEFFSVDSVQKEALEYMYLYEVNHNLQIAP